MSIWDFRGVKAAGTLRHNSKTTQHENDNGPLQNLFNIYRAVIDRWSLYDNGQHTPVLLAYGDAKTLTVVAKNDFEKIVGEFNLTV